MKITKKRTGLGKYSMRNSDSGTFVVETKKRIKKCPCCGNKPTLIVEKYKKHLQTNECNLYYRVRCESCIETHRCRSVEAVIFVWNQRSGK